MRTAALLVAAALLLYLGVTAYAGYRVGSAIRDAQRSNVEVRAGAAIFGERAIERIALRRAQLPAWITGSPAFWPALRRAERP